jgi:hypothetical protein
MTGAGEDRVCGYRRLVKAFFEGNADDIKAALCKEQSDFLDKLAVSVRQTMTKIYLHIKLMPNFDIEDVKESANSMPYGYKKISPKNFLVFLPEYDFDLDSQR